MLPANNLLNTIKALALSQKPLPTAAADAAPKGVQFEPGQKLQGSVQAQLSPGLFKVSVAGQTIQMQLPAFIRSGDTVKLQVIATTPRLSFSMSASTNPLSTPESLSSVARLLSALSQQPLEKTYVRAAHSAPLWATPQPPQSIQLAGLLREALGNSGLFYESHQAQWLEGARSTAQLLREPQNLPPKQTSNQTSNQTSAAATGAELSRADTPRLPNTAGSAEGKALGIPEHLQPLVQQQINTLETRQMLWQGNVWPGQAMQWEIHEQSPPPPAAQEQQQWVTQIHLDLPRLGKVTAMLRFDSAGLSLTLDAGATATRAALGSASSQLVAALTDGGIPVISALVTQHEAAR